MPDLKRCWICDYLLSKHLNPYISTAFYCLLVDCSCVLNLSREERSFLSCKGKPDFKSIYKMVAGVCLQTFQHILIFTFIKFYWMTSSLLIAKCVFNSFSCKIRQRRLWSFFFLISPSFETCISVAIAVRAAHAVKQWVNCFSPCDSSSVAID